MILVETELTIYSFLVERVRLCLGEPVLQEEEVSPFIGIKRKQLFTKERVGEELLPEHFLDVDVELLLDVLDALEVFDCEDIAHKERQQH
jgi:hypothetical protein